MKNYFKVIAKCGHVGRDSYYEGVFYEVAESKSHAAQIVRGRGRVKHHHKDAILSVEPITFEEYQMGVAKKSDEVYFNCHNSSEQALAWEEIAKFIKPETNRRERYQHKKEVQNDRLHYDGKRRIKNPVKYGKYYADNTICEYAI